MNQIEKSLANLHATAEKNRQAEKNGTLPITPPIDHALSAKAARPIYKSHRKP
jgi:hypothetical protein